MASPFGPLVKDQPYISTIPFDIVAQVGQYKQGMYDTAIQQTQAKLDFIGSQKIQKASDKEYITNELNNTVEQLNNIVGKDFSDPKIRRELDSITSGLMSNPNVARRVNANARFTEEQTKRAELLEKNPELYSPVNDAVYQQQVSQWMNNPDQVDFSGSYIPFYDNSKDLRDIAKEIASNPDIGYEIIQEGGMTYQKEVKQVRADRISDAWKAQILSDPRALQQERLNYQYAMSNISPEVAIGDLATQIKVAQDNIKEAERQIGSGVLSEDEINQRKAFITQNQGAVEKFEQMSDIVRQTGDASKYYTFDNYLNNNLKSQANQYAYTQEGKLELEEYSKLQYQERSRASLEALKHSFKVKEEAMKAAQEQAESLANGPQLDYFPETSKMDELMFKGTTTVNSGDLHKYSNILGKQQDDGSYSINLTNTPIYTNLNIGISSEGQVNMQQMDAVGRWTSEYSKWKSSKPTELSSTYNGKPVQRQVSEVDGSTRYFIYDAQGNPQYVNVNSLETNDSIESFNNSPEGQKLKQKYIREYGVDPTDPTLTGSITEYLNSPQGQAESKWGYTLNGLMGKANFTIDSGDNLVTGVDGSVMMKGSIVMRREDIISQMDSAIKKAGGNGSGERAFNELVDAGQFAYQGATPGFSDNTGRGEKNGLYSLNVMIPTDKKVEDVFDETINESITSDKYRASNIPVLKRQATERARLYQEYAPIRNIPISTLMGRSGEVMYNIQNMDIPDLSVDGKQVVQNEYNNIVELAQSNDPDISMRARIALNKLSNLQVDGGLTGQQIKQELGLLSPGSVPIEITNKETYLTPLKESIKKVYDNIPADIRALAEQAGEKYNVPPNLILANLGTESSFQNNARSPKGALGIAQLMPDTATELGVEDPLDPAQAVNGMAKYMRKLHDRFDNWELVVGAYNSGPNKPSYAQGKLPQIEETLNHVRKVYQAYNYLEPSAITRFKSSGESGLNNIGEQGLKIGNEIADRLGYTPTFNSIYRSQSHQQRLVNQGPGVKNSYHLTGDAVDMKPSDWNKLSAADKKYFQTNYDVVSHNGHIHIEPKGRP